MEELVEKFARGCEVMGGTVDRGTLSVKCRGLAPDMKLELFRRDEPFAHLKTPRGDVTIDIEDVDYSEDRFGMESEGGKLEVVQEFMKVKGEEIKSGRKFKAGID